MTPELPTRITRRQLLGAVGAGAIGLAAAGPSEAAEDLVRPTPQQLAWQEAGLTMFVHFGMNTFTNREWGEGTEEPRLFNPTNLDCRQWARVASSNGFRFLILTAKHHDGFCLWPTAETEHCVRNSPWRDGHGDVVAEAAAACKEFGLKFGVYVSPWDRHDHRYGDSPAYNTHFCAQLTELLTRYGDIAEVWFDGACGEGPNGKKQVYDWPSFYKVVRKHQPHALIAVCGPDIRWVGNEDGFAHDTEWCTHDADPSLHSAGAKTVWWPSECDVSIRPGWFYHPNEDAQVKTVAQLMDIYYRSVGHNSVLLLNVPPNPEGRFSNADVTRLREFRQAREATFRNDFLRGTRAVASSASPGAPATAALDGRTQTAWSPKRDALPATLEVTLPRPATVNVTLLEEQIAFGQHVEEYTIDAMVDGAWKRIVNGTTIGHRKLDRFEPIRAERIRLTIAHSRNVPRIRAFGAYDAPAYAG